MIPFRCATLMAIAVGILLVLAPTRLQAQATGHGAGTPMAPEAPSPAEAETLYERLGGLQAIALVVDDFMAEFTADPLILANPAVRERKGPESHAYITYQVTTLVCQLSGGPCEYTGLDMRQAHEGLNVSEAEWDRMVEIFAATLARHQVPERETEELFGLLGPAQDDIVVPARR